MNTTIVLLTMGHAVLFGFSANIKTGSVLSTVDADVRGLGNHGLLPLPGITE